MSRLSLLVVRHAIAEDKERFARTGQDDDQRPLTDDGREKMRRGALGLRVLVPEIALLATSPLVRAAETAEILVDAYGGIESRVLQHLAPDASHAAFLVWLSSLSRLGGDRGPIAVVGHEPHLGQLVSWLVSGRRYPVLSLKKGGACLIEFDGSVEAGRGRIAWSLTPAQLRMLAPG